MESFKFKFAFEFDYWRFCDARYYPKVVSHYPKVVTSYAEVVPYYVKDVTYNAKVETDKHYSKGVNTSWDKHTV